MDIRILLSGFGTVGKAFCQHIAEKSDYISQTYGFRPLVVGVIGSQGCLYDPKGIRVNELVTCEKGSAGLVRYAHSYGMKLGEPIFDANVLVESTPTDLQDGGPAYTYIQKALSNGMHVVSISKGALVTRFSEIMSAAKRHHVQVKYSGATGAALPALDIGLVSLAGSRLLSIEGILNGTTNFILTSMHEADMSYREALKLAQEKGIAETNPVLDVSGMDSACKILLLSNSLFDTAHTLQQVEITGIETVHQDEIRRAKESGEQIKLLARASMMDGHFQVSVAPQAISTEHPLYGVKGTNKAVHFQTEEMGSIVCSGGASHPRGAAAAALKDLIAIFRR
ncbi:homoserine dehydrogenase [Brevibacillus migulae]|uniref:homoserine dehydrogenase n=1 Tax=Brevibacillus migulae TaxID=1644114 RepID=UPI00106F0608|nr:homoserine dehydrogenase [Brevibacillus migulae]